MAEMLRYTAKMGALSIAGFFAVTAVIFAMMNIAGNWFEIARLGLRGITPGQYEFLRSYFRPDLPIYDRYFIWVSQLLTGNFGISLYSASAPSQVPAWFLDSAVLSLPALAIGGGMGIFFDANLGSETKSASRLSSVPTFLVSLPSFWVGMMAILVLGVWLNLLPLSGATSTSSSMYWWGGPQLDFLAHYILPFSVLAVAYFAIFFKMGRTNRLRTDLAGETSVVRISKSLSSIGLVFALTTPLALGVEAVFAWPGLGYFLITSVSSLDVVMVADTSALLTVLLLIVAFVGKAASAWVGRAPTDSLHANSFPSPEAPKGKMWKLPFMLVALLFSLALLGASFSLAPPHNLPCPYGGCRTIPPFTNASYPLGTEANGVNIFTNSLIGLWDDVGFAAVVSFVVLVTGALVAVSSSKCKAARMVFEGLFYLAIMTPLPFSLLWQSRTGFLLASYPYNLLLSPTVVVIIVGSLTVGYLARERLESRPHWNRKALNRAIAPTIVVGAATILVKGLLDFLPIYWFQKSTMTLGALMSEGWANIRTDWWGTFFPGALMLFAIFTFVLLAEYVLSDHERET